MQINKMIMNKNQLQISVLLSIALLINIASSAFAQKHVDIISQHLSKADNYILVASHRGDWRNAPENSVQAIKNCIKMGVDIVEIDVRLTKDSVPVLMHDATIDRTTTGKGNVSDWTLDSLKTLFLKSGCDIATRHKVPTLEQAMITAKGHILVNLDKCSGYMDKAVKVLVTTGTMDQAIFKGTKDIGHMRDQYGALLDKIIFMPIISENTPNLEGFVDDYLKEYNPLAFEVLFTNDSSNTLSVISMIKTEGARIWINTLWESLCGPHDDELAVDDPDASWGWVIAKGATIIQTDRPQLLLEYLQQKKLRQ